MIKNVRQGIVSLAVAVGTMSATPAIAQDEGRDLRPYVSPQFRLIDSDDDRNTDKGMGFELSVGKGITDNFGIELGGFYESFDANGNAGSVDWDSFGYRINTMYFLDQWKASLPYASIGFGLAHQEPDGASETDEPFVDIGTGFFLIDRADENRNALRLDTRYRHTFLEDDIYGDEDFGELMVSLGLVFPVGKRPVAVAPVIEAPVRAGDADRDGVSDAYDRCPGTPVGVPVDSVGCPLDSDGDGVPDDLDRCPRTPAGVAVDSRGCPLKVDAAPTERRFEDVNFAFDSSRISDYASVLLDNAAAEIRALQQKYDAISVQITGHTDSIGTNEYNSDLSTRRAAAVRDYLIGKGVKPGSIVSLGFGETQPVASNKTPQGRLLNRRAEIRARAQ